MRYPLFPKTLIKNIDEYKTFYHPPGEWTYLFNNHSKKWATVNGVVGYVIAPDDFTGTLQESYANDAGLADAGNLVFLPATGYRHGSNVSYVGTKGYYWSSSAYGEYGPYAAYSVDLDDFSVHPDSGIERKFGSSVRLVTEVK
ncbi:MAG: hypothetical protein KBS58_06010 [Bacteroidales bacterium]|nr:hypothetical protein [Candidatus Cacconaster equi]